MVFTVRYILGILLVLISCSAIDAASLGNLRATRETEVPKNESLHVATTTEATQLLNDQTKTETDKHVENTAETTETVVSLVSATTNQPIETTQREEVTTEDTVTSLNTENYDGELTTTLKSEVKQQARTENGRSLDFDISKYTSAEFHNRNNVYNLPTSPENRKYVSDFEHRATTAPDFTHYSELTTPLSKFFDPKYHDYAQDLEDSEHFFAANSPKTTLNDVIEKAKRNNTESNLDFLKYTSVLNENKEGKNSARKNYENEQRLKINFDSIYNHTTTTDEEIISTTETPIVLTTAQPLEKVSFITTTKRPLPTKFTPVNKTNDQSSLFSNRIETETLKPVVLNRVEASSEENKSRRNKIENSESSVYESESGSDAKSSNSSSDEEAKSKDGKSKDTSKDTSDSEGNSGKSKEGSKDVESKDRNDESKYFGETESKDLTSSKSKLSSDSNSNSSGSYYLDSQSISKENNDSSQEGNSNATEEEKSRISNLIKLSSEEATKYPTIDSNSSESGTKSNIPSAENKTNSLKALDERNVSDELNRSPEENAINLSKRGSTKFVESDANPTTASLSQTNTEFEDIFTARQNNTTEKLPSQIASVDQNNTNTSASSASPNRIETSNTSEHVNNTVIGIEDVYSTDQVSKEPVFLNKSEHDNNVYVYVATTNSPEATTLNLAEHTETLYEITDERFDTTTEEIAYNTKRARELATTQQTDTNTDEVFYEMTTETTTMPPSTEGELFATEEYSRFVTEATEKDGLVTSTFTPEITTGGSAETRDSTAFDALITETPLDSTTQNNQETTTTETDSATVSTEESSTIASTLPPAANESTTTVLPASTNKTSSDGGVTTTEPDFDEDDDDEYIDFTHRKNNTSAHEDDALNPEAPEDIHAKASPNRTTTVRPTQEATTLVVDSTTVVEEQRGIVDDSTTQPPVDKQTTTVADGTTTTTGEHEDVTETQTEGSVLTDNESNDGTVIAITISTIGAVCLVLLAVLLFIMRRRQRKFNYGQRCTPVSLDSYSMDNVSVYNSVRRKTAIRDSKRSYGNPAFDDATVSQPLNFQALVKYANSVEEIATEFEAIPMVTARMSELPEGCELKNRYANVIPLPETRVVLTPNEDDPIGDYINANFVTGPKGVRGYYIACQAPMNNTVNDFWRMIWEQQSKVILMLTHLYETGVEKCVDYLPPSEVLDCHRLFGDYQVTLKNREVKDKYIISSLQLKNMVTNSWREVTHFWYLGWPEKGVPSEENSIIAFLIEARSYVKLVQNSTDIKIKDTSNGGVMNQDVSPVVVHCSPGTGRTGTVIACDIAIREFELRRLVDIPRIVYRIRRDRASSVQTKDQYTFIYRVINLYATKLTGGALDSI